MITKESMIQVDVPLPHDHIALMDTVHISGKTEQSIYLDDDISEWFTQKDLRRTANVTRLWLHPEIDIDYGVEMRIIESRPGRLPNGSWRTVPTHARFWFRDKRSAMLFKLTWS